MDFGLSEEQELLQETVRGFVQKECPPTRLRELFDAGRGQDDSLWKGIAEMGLAGLVVPETYGGAGMEILDLALVSEVMGEGALPVPFFGHSLACLAVAEAGSDAQRERWLPGLAEGSLIGSVALCEETSAWDPESWRVEEKGGRLYGRKLFVPHGDSADLLVVGVAGGGLVLVERRAEGISIVSQDGIDRTRPIFRVDFDGAACERLPEGAQRATRVVDVGLVLLASDSFGAGSRLVDVTVEYAKTREQFGCKIAQFQSVKHQLARLGTDIEPTRALFWHAAYACDHLPAASRRAAALCKAHISDRTLQAARMAVELHGGLGFTWECDVQMWFKRAMFDRAFLGTPHVLRERCAALAGW